MQIIHEFAITVRYPIPDTRYPSPFGHTLLISCAFVHVSELIFEFYRPFNHFLCVCAHTDNRVNVGNSNRAEPQCIFLQHDRRMSMTECLTIFSRTNNSIREFTNFFWFLSLHVWERLEHGFYCLVNHSFCSRFLSLDCLLYTFQKTIKFQICRKFTLIFAEQAKRKKGNAKEERDKSGHEKR